MFTALKPATILLLSLALASLLGCSDAPQEKSEEERAQEKLNRIQALPYVGGTSRSENEPAGVVLVDEERACPGYRLYTIPMLGRAELIDLHGNVVHTWQHGPNDRWARAEMLRDGALLVVGMEGYGWQQGEKEPGIPDDVRYLLKLDWDGKVVWQKRMLAHHDVEVTPDGHILALTFARVKEPMVHKQFDTRDERLVLLDGAGNEVESISLLESVISSLDVFPLAPIEPNQLGVRPWVDIFHANSVEWMHREHLFDKHAIYGPNNVLVCFRHQNRVAIFDWQRWKVVWAWGERMLSGPHDAQVLENGNVLLFDNGAVRDWSRAMEVNPLTNEVVWTYMGDPPQTFYTESKGSVQRLPNGNTLMAESDNGRAIEVTPRGQVVWEFRCPYPVATHDRAAIVRMVLHPKETVEPLLAGE